VIVALWVKLITTYAMRMRGPDESSENSSTSAKGSLPCSARKGKTRREWDEGRCRALHVVARPEGLWMPYY
jgi:hypothetical protein